MIKLLFKYLLSANYSFVKRWVNKKMPQQIIPSTTYFFLTPLTFIIAGLYCMILGSIEFKFTNYTPILIGFITIVLTIGFGLQNASKKAIYKWGIDKEHKSLSKDQRSNRNTFAFLFFWGGFILFCYLSVKYLGGYSLQ